MKKHRERCQGFFAGLLAAGLLLGLCSAAAAAGHSRTIQVIDDIAVTINGAYFSPRNAQGAVVPLFVYNGTTYAPIRALCDAAGLEVSFDSAARTAVITTGDMALAADPNAGTYITAERARELALAHAGVSADGIVFLQTKLDQENGRVCYDVEFYRGGVEYDCELDARTGQVVSFDYELENYDIHQGASQSASENLITAQRAKEIALSRAPQGAQVVKCQLDRDDGRYIYEVELRLNRTEYECDVNAVTGVILKWDVDYD